MLADGARVGGDGKLYIFGGQWDRLYAPSVPTTHPIVAIALVVELEYGEALDNHPVEITLRDADGATLGPRAMMNLRVGHPPQLERGGSVTVPIAMELPQIVFPGMAATSGSSKSTGTWRVGSQFPSHSRPGLPLVQPAQPDA